jgi:hypothetical protein
MTPEQRAEAARLYKSKTSGSTLAARYQVSWNTLRRYLIEDGVTLRTPAEANSLMKQPSMTNEKRSCWDKKLASKYQGIRLV